jgi:hypothetical protein
VNDQIKEKLHIGTIVQGKRLNVEQTVQHMKQEIGLHLPRSWEEVKRRVAVPMGFDGDVIQYQLKTKIQEA